MWSFLWHNDVTNPFFVFFPGSTISISSGSEDLSRIRPPTYPQDYFFMLKEATHQVKYPSDAISRPIVPSISHKVSPADGSSRQPVPVLRNLRDIQQGNMGIVLPQANTLRSPAKDLRFAFTASVHCNINSGTCTYYSETILDHSNEHI